MFVNSSTTGLGRFQNPVSRIKSASSLDALMGILF